jgi:hypothetical protein
MHDIARRCLDMFIRVREYAVVNPAHFPAESFAAEQLDTVNEVIAGLGQYTGAQAAGLSNVHEGTMSKAAAKAELVRDMQAVNRTARPMSRIYPGIMDKFRMPYNASDQALLAAARAFATNAEPLKAEFIKRGLPENFLEDLQADIAQLEAAIAHMAQSRDTHVEATATIDELIERGMNAVNELEPIMRNTLTNDQPKLAAWLSASHVASKRQSSKQKASPATPPAPHTP